MNDSDDELLVHMLDRPQANSQIQKRYLTTPNSFTDFPHLNPYDQQVKLMQFIYSGLENSRHMIVESPTGTGKSATLLTSTLRWLSDHIDREHEYLEHIINKIKNEFSAVSDELDWITAYGSAKSMKNQYEPIMNKLSSQDLAICKARNLRACAKGFRARKRSLEELIENDQVELPISYNAQIFFDDLISNPDEESEFLLNEFVDESEESNNEYPKSDELSVPQIIYCSRTHSQLSQIALEFDKIGSNLVDSLTILTLASRQSLCVHEPIYSLKNAQAINESCLELIKRKSGCPMKSKSLVTSMSEHILSFNIASTKLASQIRTKVEDKNIRSSNKKRFGCPYYAARTSIPFANLILCPYNTLIHPKTREASGINVEDRIIIFDEAHNILEATMEAFSCQLSFENVASAFDTFKRYKERYSSKLSSLSVLRINQLIQICRSIMKIATFEKLLTTAEFLELTSLENFSFFELVQYFEKNHTVNKLAGFASWSQKKNSQMSEDKSTKFDSLIGEYSRKDRPKDVDVDLDKENKISASGAILSLSAFLTNLGKPEKDSRILLDQKYLKYLILDPGSHLKQLISKSRSVILAGGTMKPFEEFINQIFVPIDHSKVLTFSCGHIIDANKQLIIFTPQKRTKEHLKWDFTYESRKEESILNDCGKFLIDLSKNVNAGIVVFFPSYEYLYLICNYWRKNKLMEELERFKDVFQEPKKLQVVDSIISSFAQSAEKGEKNNHRGSCLLCVIGGKLSEGINFSDSMARAVVIVGLPYANPKDPILSAKMEYLDNNYSSKENLKPGRIYYQSKCFRAINQALGRAIRHSKDYAAVFLLDNRFSTLNVQSNLPDWTRSTIRTDMNDSDWSKIFNQTRAFLLSNKTHFR